MRGCAGVVPCDVGHAHGERGMQDVTGNPMRSLGLDEPRMEVYSQGAIRNVGQR